MHDSTRVDPDPWLSRQMGIPCFSWSGHAHDFPSQEWADLARGERDWMLTAYLPRALEDDESPHALPGSPVLCDTRITFRYSPRFPAVSFLDALPTSPRDGIVIRPLEAGDATAVRDIAGRAFRFSRFHADPRIPRRVANSIKSKWARNLAFGSRGAGGWIVEKSGVIAGFLGVARGHSEVPTGEHLAVDLVAVAPEYASQGLGTMLLGTAIEDACTRGVDLIASTQEANVAAAKLYLRSGLRWEPPRTWIIHCRPEDR